MPRATRTFRIIASSTFEDVAAKRNALQAEAPADEFDKIRAGVGAPWETS